MGDCQTERHQALVSLCHFRLSGFGNVGGLTVSTGSVNVAAPAFLFLRCLMCAGFGAGPLAIKLTSTLESPNPYR